MFNLDLEKAEEPEIKLPTSPGSWKKNKRVQKNIYFYFIDYTKALDCVDYNKLWKIPKEMRNMYTGQEETELDVEQLGKEYIKAVYCHPAYSTYMQSTSCEMLGWEIKSCNLDS